MRHRIADKKFNRSANQRSGLLDGLVRSLIERREIVTTISKAKVLKRMMEKLVYQAQNQTLASRRMLAKSLHERKFVNTLVDYIAPSMKKRSGGYVKLESIGKRRGDNVMMMKVSFTQVSAQAEKGKETIKKVKPASKTKIKGGANKKSAAEKAVKNKVVKSKAVAKSTEKKVPTKTAVVKNTKKKSTPAKAKSTKKKSGGKK